MSIKALRPIRCFAVLIIISSLLLGSCALSGEPDPGDYAVEFADPGLEQAVRWRLETPDGDIMTSDLDNLKVVHIWPDRVQFNNTDDVVLEGAAVERFDDLAHFRELRGVLVAEFPIENVDFLAGLDTLQRVVLDYNDELVDISALAELPRLVTAVIHHNGKLSDFSPVGEARELRELDLHNCGLESIEFLESLEKLSVLILHNNRISDISPLAASPGLLEVDLHANRISDIGGLSGLPELFRLRIEGNEISDLTPLSGLESMKYLALDENDITNLSPLENLVELRRLTLAKNPLSPEEVAALRAKLPPGCEISWEA